MKQVIFSFFAIVGMVCSLLGCSSEPVFRYSSGMAWGTVYNIKYKAGADLSDSILKVIEQINLSLSPFREGSLISRVNSSPSGAVEADSMLIEVLELSQQVCGLSDGAFDPTLAPLINLWGFGYKEGAIDIPSDTQIDSALQWVGIMDCGIDPEGRVIKKSDRTEFNFSAIAKGYGVDMIARMLDRCGASDYMVEVGGEVSLKGHNPNDALWGIQVDAPEMEYGAPSHQRLTALELSDRCIATSGNYRNHHPTSHGEVSHTISPATGRPVSSDILSITVIAPSTAMADALATASMAMPADEVREMLSSLRDVDYIIVRGAMPDSVSVLVSDNCPIRR